MKLLKLYNILIKKSFKLDKYVLKSGLLDILFLLLFFVCILISFSFFQYYLMNVSVLEENYSVIANQESFGDNYNTMLLQNYSNTLNSLFYLVIGVVIFLFLLLFLFSTLIKMFQYRMLDKSYFKNFKEFIKSYWVTLRNTFPLFFIFCLLSTIFLLIITNIILLAIILLVLTIFYCIFMPFIRIYSLKKKIFSKSWSVFFNNFNKFIKIIPIQLIFTFICILLILIFGLISNSFNSLVLEFIFILIIIFLVIINYVFLRRYISNSIKLINYINKK